jgi:hypothetical protein
MFCALCNYSADFVVLTKAFLLTQHYMRVYTYVGLLICTLCLHASGYVTAKY